jgi:threonine/homoserine/homoserine lactone efflux protein
MTDEVTFILGAALLLATPGPTNTLLAASGAATGFRASLGLLCGELGGYLMAIAVLMTAVGPIIAASPAFAIALRVAVVLYLLYLAAALWRRGALAAAGARPVTLPRVFVTTLLNPKAVIFAFTLLPTIPPAEAAEVMAHLAALSALILMIGSAWIAAGATLRHRLDCDTAPRLGCRAGAIAMILFACVTGMSVVRTVWG